MTDRRAEQAIRATGEAARLINAFDWTATGLGPIARWPATLRSTVELMLASPVPIVTLWGVDGIMIYNDAYSVFAGTRHPRLLGSKVREGWAEIADFNDNVMRVGLAGGTLQYRDQALTLDRGGAPEPVWMDLDYSPIHGPDGTPIGVIAIVVETTGKVRAERALRDSEERYRILTEVSPQVVWMADAAGALTYCNAYWYAYSGMSEAETRGQGWLDAVHPDHRAAAQQGWRAAVAERDRWSMELPLRRRDGAYRWHVTAGQPLLDGTGRCLSWSGIALDIHDRRTAEEELRDTGSRLDAVLANTSMAIFVIDLSQACVFMNRAAERLTGWRLEDIRGRRLHDVIHHSHADGSPYPPEDCPIERAFPTGAGFSGEETFVRRDGRFIPVALTASPVVDPRGGTMGTIIEARDISADRAAQAVIARRGDQLRGLADAALAISLAPNPTARLDEVARAARRIVGAEQAVVSLTRGADWAQAITAIELSPRYEAWRDYDRPPSGGGIYALVCEQNRPLRLTQAELERHPRWRGFSAEASAHPPMRGWLAVPLVARDGSNLGLVQLSDKSDGGDFDEADEAMLVQLAQLAAAAIEQSETDAALRRSEERYRAITDSVDQMIWATRADGYHDFFNQRWYDYTGVPVGSTEGEAWRGLFHPEDQARIDATWGASLATGRPYHIEYRLRHRSGLYRWVIGRAQPVRDGEGRITRWYGSCTDIHDLKEAEAALRDLTARLEERVREEVAERAKAEEALRQTQKMEAVGQLTGGIAHDFNNLLTVVTGNIDMAGRALDAAGAPDPRARRALDNAMKGADRAAALTQRLLAFARRQPLAPKPIDVDRLVAGMSDLLNRALGETVRLEVVTTPGLWRVEADPNQLESAILNLAVNARDAMPAGGTLAIETANAMLDQAYAGAHAEVAPGPYVLISVSDTGMGIPREAMERVFEPFYTTKEVGRGTGLGLSMVYGFVKQSGGHVKLYSEEGRGTTVKIYLPRLLGSLPEPIEEGEGATGIERSQRAETILVVEDDDDVRAYTVEILRELGYRVLEAHDGMSGLRLFERQEAPIDLLFTDVVMPGMTGAALAEQARALQPGLRVLYTSGYTRNAIVHGGRLDAGVEMISKPFTFRALAAKVRDMLEIGRTGRLLLVEAEPTIRALTAEALAAIGYAVDQAATATEALARLRAAQGRYDAALIDADLPDQAAIALLVELRARHAAMPVLLAGDPPGPTEAAPDPLVAALPKPFTAAMVEDRLRALGVGDPPG